MLEKQHPKKKRKYFPFRGLMTCAKCGCLLTASRKKKKYVYYYGGHTGRRNGFFSEYDYYRFYASSHENVLYGPWQFLDCVPKECF